MQVFQHDTTERVATLPTLDEYGLLWRNDKWVALSPIEERLIKAFLAEPGRVINRRALGQAGWPNGAPNVRSVDARIKVLRPRVEPLSVRIHTVRGHGYLADFTVES